MTLTIETGKYYRTRDGRKVGPMVGGRDKKRTGYPWTDKGENHDGRWADCGEDGESCLMGPTDGDLIAEWTDEPAATHAETAPRVQMIRGNLTPEMKRWLRSVPRAARTNTAKTPSRREATIMGEVGL